MPFWWGRRKRFWHGTRYRRWGRRKPRYKTRRKPRRRRYTRAPRRRRRRRRKYKVRRKRKLITIKQWQPDKIVTCKIKGYDSLVLGAEGKQLVCYTNVKQAWTPPKTPGGGGFGVQQYSLGYLYEQYIFRKNIWTKSNIALDLVRYLKVKMTFYRHPETDFILNYDRQPPFTIDEWTYPFTHPAQLILGKHKFFVLSTATKPLGRLTKRKIIKPPKQMLTKWFFQEDFATAGLLQIRAAAANFRYSNLGCCNTNQIITAFSINTNFFQQGNWAVGTGERYRPYLTIPYKLYYWPEKPPPSIETEKRLEYNRKYMFTQEIKSYDDSVSYEEGYFSTKVLTAKFYSQNTTDDTGLAHLPLLSFRYNPALDSGKGNAIWLHSSLTTSYDKPSIDKTLILQGLPLWQMLWGWLSYVQYVKKATDFFTSHIIVLQSPAIKPLPTVSPQQYYIPLSADFVNGKPPYNEPLTTWWRAHWYPNIYDQLPVLNAIVESGPLVPKYSQTKNSTWELKYTYNFLFKWGGPDITEPAVADPSQQQTYPVPDKQSETIQIRDPAKQKYQSILHSWDYRRGLIKESAFKRMQDNLSIDSTFEPDEPPKKRKKIVGPCLTVPGEEDQEVQACLQALCEESTYQEIPQEVPIQQLIQQQHEKQQQLKWNILRVISDLKEKQRQLQLQTGFIN
nr:MAG: ORF1 [Torque teno midi virus]